METAFPLSFIQRFHHVGGLGNSYSDLSKTEAGLMTKGRGLRTFVYVCVCPCACGCDLQLGFFDAEA